MDHIESIECQILQENYTKTSSSLSADFSLWLFQVARAFVLILILLLNLSLLHNFQIDKIFLEHNLCPENIFLHFTAKNIFFRKASPEELQRWESEGC